MDTEFEVLKEYVRISKYRYRVMRVLSKDEVKIPKQISSEAGIRKNHISKILGELKNKKLVECINEESRKGRLYRLTSLGEKVKNSIFKVNGRYILTENNLIYDSKTDKEYDIVGVVSILNSQNETVNEYYNIILS